LTITNEERLVDIRLARLARTAIFACLTWSVSGGHADEIATNDPVTLENVVAPDENRADEPLAEAFSLEQATRFLDSAALDWQKSRQCMTCHTNYAYLLARPAIDADVPAHAEVRDYAEKLVTERWPDQGPRWDAEVVMTALALASNDAATTGTLHPVTKAALDRMWTLQREDGGWNWLKCQWPPMESDDDFAIGVVALAAGLAPEGYAGTPAAQGGLEKLRGYLRANPPPTLHHRLMLLWASGHVDSLLNAD
jgi:squalene-hopene/tetraprenyl-beta-curcumene cyclase